MSTEIRPEPELPFRPKEQITPGTKELNEILTGATKTFDFGSEKENSYPYDLHAIEGQYDLTDEEIILAEEGKF